MQFLMVTSFTSLANTDWSNEAVMSIERFEPLTLHVCIPGTGTAALVTDAVSSGSLD